MSTAQHAKPKVIGHNEPVRVQLINRSAVVVIKPCFNIPSTSIVNNGCRRYIKARFYHDHSGSIDQLDAHWLIMADDLWFGVLRGRNDACRRFPLRSGPFRGCLPSESAAV